jgi:single-strand DNA-binding protein
MKVAIEGRLHYSSWEKDGHKRSKITVNVDEVEFLSQRNGAQGQSRQQANNYSTQGQNAPNSAPQQSTEQFQDDYYSEDIPF